VTRDINGQIEEYRGLVESLARKFVGRNGAEFDDLVQEGLIDVWTALTKGLTPSAAVISGRMANWVRLLGTQTGEVRTTNGAAVRYVELLPIEPLIEDEAFTLDPIPLAGHDPLA
jgi:DNA-directed RNA polymerase specialized sigma24 family protein